MLFLSQANNTRAESCDNFSIEGAHRILALHADGFHQDLECMARVLTIIQTLVQAFSSMKHEDFNCLGEYSGTVNRWLCANRDGQAVVKICELSY